MKDLTKNVEFDRQEAIDRILGDLPTETEMVVDVPSRCKFYTKKGPVIVKPLKFEDEKILLSGKKSRLDPINIIISKCVEGVDIPELLEMDKMFLLMKIREISYGDNYAFEVACLSCGSNFHIDLKLSERMLIREVPDEVKDPRKVFLPKIKKEAVVRFIRLKEEVYLKDEATATQNLWRFVESIDGCNDPSVISEVLKKLPLADMKTLVEGIKLPGLGVDPRFIFTCGDCGSENEMEIPLTPNFFSLT